MALYFATQADYEKWRRRQLRARLAAEVTGYTPDMLTGGWENQTYDVTLNTAAKNTGGVSEFVGTWNYQSTAIPVQYFGAGFNNIVGFSFLSTVPAGAKILSATLHYEIVSRTAGTSIELNIEAPKTPSGSWDTGDTPVASTPLAQIAGIAATSTGVKSQSVTDLVQQAVNHADYDVDDYLRFWFEPEVNENLTISVWSGTASAGITPRLEITYGLEGVTFPNRESFLYFGNANGNDTLDGLTTKFDNAAVSCWVKLTDVGDTADVVSCTDISKILTSAVSINSDNEVGGMGWRGETFSVALPAVSGPGAIPDRATASVSDGWAHYLIKIERQNATATDRYRMWKNGVEVEGTDWHNSSVPLYPPIAWCISGHGDTVALRQGASGLESAFINGSIAELWLHYSSDAASLPDPEDFLDIATLTPKDLGSDGSTPTGTQPLVYMSGDATAWSAGTNLGSAADFTRYGDALEDAT